MGVSLMGSSWGSGSCDCKECKPKNPNPDPNNWKLEKIDNYGPYVVVCLHYPDCTNYEGRKVVVFRASFQQLHAQGGIDPHFGEDDKIYPIARFRPTEDGWWDACEYARRKQREEPDQCEEK